MATSTDNAVTFPGRLPLWQKLALVGAAMAIPAVMLGCFYFQQTSAPVQQARGELTGTYLLRALVSVMQDAGGNTNRALEKVSMVSHDMPTQMVEQRPAKANQHRAIVGGQLDVGRPLRTNTGTYCCFGEESLGHRGRDCRSILPSSPRESHGLHAMPADYRLDALSTPTSVQNAA